MVVTSRPSADGGQRQAGQHAPAVDQHGAGAALAVVAALLGAGQAEVLAQRVEQRGADIERNAMLAAVDPQRKADRRAGVPRVLGANGLCRSDARNRRQGRRRRGRHKEISPAGFGRGAAGRRGAGRVGHDLSRAVPIGTRRHGLPWPAQPSSDQQGMRRRVPGTPAECGAGARAARTRRCRAVAPVYGGARLCAGRTIHGERVRFSIVLRLAALQSRRPARAAAGSDAVVSVFA